jgi:hypothetical protein
MLRHICIVAFLLPIAIQCFSQGPCQAKPGDTTVVVPLNSNSMEPACEPSRIRVSDRTSVAIKVVNVSPVEVCVASSKPPTVTTVTNPLESIINTITAYKSFDFESAKPAHDLALHSLHSLYGTPPEGKPKEKTPDELARDLFYELADEVFPAAMKAADKQNAWQALYKEDTDELTKYIAADYRGPLYKKFDPDNDAELATVQSHTRFPPISINAGDATNPPSEVDYAPLQALIDEMKALQPRLITACTTPDAAGKTAGSCDPVILAKTAELIDQANAIMLVLQDNLKSLQTAQAAIVASVAVLHKIKVDFNARVNAKIVEVAPIVVPGGTDTILVQTIHLGTDYGATDAGTISCSTDTSPAIPTTDTINYAILYQNVPALTASAGLLITFLEKRIIGSTQKLDADGTTVDNVFAITDSARASVFPMAFVNYRIAPPILRTWWGQPNSELVISHNVSAGIGVNSNTGTNQPEFFGGYAIGFSRVLIHAGVHYGRTEKLGGGFSLGKVPPGFTGTTAPIDWSYHPAFAIGFSVRIAPF